MITLIDSHCHLDQLDLSCYDGKLQAALDTAKAQGIEQMLCVCIDLENLPNVLRIAEDFTQVTASVGLHPNEIVNAEPSVAELVALAAHPRVVAIGETGLDYYRSSGDLSWQQQRFRNHIKAAKQTQKPLIVHTRDARADTLKILREENAAEIGGVLHCFTEDWDTASQAMELNFYISFSGIVTFANAKNLQDVAKRIPLERMLIETDAPYLTPMPHRGKPNEPAYVRVVAEQIAKLRGVSLEVIAEHTTRNFLNLFGGKTSPLN